MSGIQLPNGNDRSPAFTSLLLGGRWFAAILNKPLLNVDVLLSQSSAGTPMRRSFGVADDQ